MKLADCFALLDDASPDAGQARSRLYSDCQAVLRCDGIGGWPQLLADLQGALARGLYAVPLLAYELGGALQRIPVKAGDTPLAQVLLFAQCARLTPAEVAAWLATQADARPAGISAVRANVGQDEFTRALNRIHDYIAAGDTYQVNYTYRLRFDAFGSLHALYARLRARQPVPYGALVALPGGDAVLSLSPELFVRHAGGELVTRPMKGTAPASGIDAEDARRAAALAQDTKNRAENLMIVDLLRNDLGRIAATGSVEVPALFDVQRYTSVLQMTSTVRAKLRHGVSLADVFQALYPCGSITGAPKRRTMEIIDELEPAPRGIYTGAIGWFDPPANGQEIGDFCMSVPIRTLMLKPERDGVRQGEMGVGAGIVFDSDPVDEFAECRLKARFLTGLGNDFELFETMRATHDGIAQRDMHLARIGKSAAYFGFAFDRDAALAALNEACGELGDGAFRMRLALQQDGAMSVGTAPLAPLQEPVKVLLAPDATHSDDLFLRHKTSVRGRYDAAWRDAEAQGGFDTLFFNERGELTEGGRSNVFVRLDGRWYTPPLPAGVLPGVMRAAMLADPAWAASERAITRAVLDSAEEIVVCNALRGPLRAVKIS
ncbi:aminodeoxychorismate synthase component I [Massilia soli]|uniref:Aminodeoxychorismate synthase component I n=1 Tax=Massilia soli TaxID=2792854 RepID=A0ABS7SJ06_9BURK|nr:aminodeoxychorismate synthase component I [Massilia soli]MBZ2206199.1 aminodeoxychorismate synthase component I [Massilia soli]